MEPAQNSPISDYWTYPPPPDQKCINDGLSMKVAAVLNTLSELVIAILPMIAVYRLRVDARQRWSVISLLSLSFFVAIAGCFRTYYVWKTVDTYDMSWWGTPHWICSEVEIDVALGFVEVLDGDDRAHARNGQRSVCIDRIDDAMCHTAADHDAVELVGTVQIVGIAALAAQQKGIFLPRNWLSDGKFLCHQRGGIEGCVHPVIAFEGRGFVLSNPIKERRATLPYIPLGMTL